MTDAWPGTPDEGAAPMWPGTPDAPAHAPVPTGGFDTATAADMAKSAGIGVVKGGLGLAGMGGDIASGFQRGADWAAQKVGLPEGTGQAVTNFVKNAVVPYPARVAADYLGVHAPTSQELTHKLESVTGPLYEPKTKAGQYAQTVGEFAPGMIGGPEGLAYKAATRVLAPAVASETAGQATEGTALEPYARVAGALVGHGMGTGTAKAFHPGENVPSIEDLHEAATKGYNNARGYGVEIYRKPVARQADDMLSELASDGFRERNVPKTWSAIEELKNPLGQHATIDDIESVRKALLRAGSNPLEGAEREASRRAIGSIDSFLENLDPKHVAINRHYAADVAQELKSARANWAAMKGGEAVLDKIEAAERRAGSTYSGTNLDNATRQNIRKFLDNPKLKRQLSPAEQAQAKRIVDGTFIGNMSRLAGKNLRWILGSVIGHDIGGIGGLLASHAAGHALTHTGAALTSREAAKLSRMVRADSPLGRSLPQPPPAPVVSNVERAGVGLLGRNTRENEAGTSAPFAQGGKVSSQVDKPLWWKKAMARRKRAEGGALDDDPFEAAAARVRNSVRPEGGREEGVGTAVATKFIPALAHSAASNFMLGPQLMGDVASGAVDPNSEEGIQRATQVAMANVGRPAVSRGSTLGSGAMFPEKYVASSTPAFKNWFGKSQVVNESGEPLVLYKAMYPYDWTKETKTQRGPLLESIDRQTEFPSFNGTEPGVKIAGFFGDAKTANRFADVHGESSIYPVFVKMEKPHVIDAKGEKAGNIQFGKSGKPFRDAIRSGKYDGVIIKNTADEGDIYVPLRPHQIKSAIGNRGTFDPDDPRLHRAKGGKVPPLKDKPLWWQKAMARRKRADGGALDDDPFEAAAARVRNSVRPEGGREEGVGTAVATKFIPALAHSAARNFMLGPQLMGDVASGAVDPNSEEGIQRAAQVAMANVGRPAVSKGTTLGSGARFPVESGVMPNPREELSSVAEVLKQKHGLEKLELYPTSGGDMELSMLQVPNAARKQGIGTAAMQDITKYADERGQRIVLDPALRDDRFGTTGRKRLIDFYKRFGFVENKGRNKDFTTRRLMYRTPNVGTSE